MGTNIGTVYLSLILTVVCLVCPSQGTNSYVVLCPTVVRPGVPFTVNVHILRSSGPVTVTVSILKETEQVLSNLITVNQGQPYDVDLIMPSAVDTGSSYSCAVEGTGGLEFRNQTEITLDLKSMSIVIQTDKAIYKPGQTVKFRALAIYPYLGVNTGEFDVAVKDPDNNIIEQWLGLSNNEYGVIKGEMVTSSQPVLGEWTVSVTSTESGLNAEKQFVIDEYVLPKFEVKVITPSFLERSDNKLAGVVKATYTYDKPVKGTAVITGTLRYLYSDMIVNDNGQVLELSVELDGESDFEISMADISRLNSNYFPEGMRLEIKAVVTEALTGKDESSSAEVQFFTYPVVVEFLDITPGVFKPGLSFTAYVMVTLENGQPLRPTDRQLVKMSVQYDMAVDPQEQTISVPATGIVKVTYNVPDNAEVVYINANYYASDLSSGAMHTASRAKSPSDNYLQITTSSASLSAGDRASFTVTATEPFTNYFYQVLSRGNIVAEDVVQGAAARSHTFVLDVSHAMAPTAHLVVYYVRNDGEVVADYISVDVKKPFENEVSVAFNKDQAEPGDAISVDVTASPNAYVGILAVDQSVLLLRSGNDITQDEVFEELRSYDTALGDNDPFYPQPLGGRGGEMFIDRKKRSKSKRSIWMGYWSLGGIDASTIFKNAGLRVMSDATIHEEPSMFNRYPGSRQDELMGRLPMAGGEPMVDDDAAFDAAPPEKASTGTELQAVERVRKYFPETWLWEDDVTDSNGEASFSSQVPDTITSWIVSSFSVSTTTGFGVVPTTATMQAFKPFFVSLNLPYSIVRGEETALQAMVFNYMEMDMDVVLTLEKSADFQNILISSSGEYTYSQSVQTATISVPAGEGRSLAFPVRPVRVGNIVVNVKAQSTVAADAVERILLVETEGIPHENTKSVMVDLSSSNQYQETFDIILPSEGLISDSVKTKISLVGDIMGNAMNNLDQLLRMPSGCGEQTMIGFAPDVFICKYLTTTNQANQQIMDKGIRFMKEGYQRELNYMHPDGSFSAFGQSDPAGSTWLTAFVVKSFTEAMDFIYIDPNVVVNGIRFLVSQQGRDDSFEENGRVIDGKLIQGGIDGPMALTAYTMIALSATDRRVTEAMSETLRSDLNDAKSRARIYLERGFSSIGDHPHTVAVVTLALHLSQSTYRDGAFEKLNSLATIEGSLMFWDEKDVDVTRWSKSAAIEITGYALLTYNLRQDLTGATAITRWLTSQSNQFGGFTSTQDTVIGLEALCGYAGVGSEDGRDFTATITTTEMPSYQHQLRVNNDNSLVLQQVELPVTSGIVKVDLAGRGTGLLQLTVSYHTTDDPSEQSFNLVIVTNDISNNQISIAACTRYLLGENTGMAVMEVGLPSGFYADQDSLQELIGATETLKRTEVENSKAVLYFDEIGAENTCVTFQARRSAPVAKTQAATVAVYDYYKPELQQTVTYTSEKQVNTEICEVCEDCQGCENAKFSSNEPRLCGTLMFTLLVSTASILIVVRHLF